MMRSFLFYNATSYHTLLISSTHSSTKTKALTTLLILTMTATATPTTSSSTTTSFPIGSCVLLQNLVNGSQFNDKKGIVKSHPDANSGRQEVYVFEAQRSMAIKPSNLRYEPRDLSSLSITEMRGLLRIYSSDSNNNYEAALAGESECSGMNKEELRSHVTKVLGTTISNDAVQIAELVARSNVPKDTTIPSNSSASASSSSLHSSQLRQGAERMSQMSPNDIRQQAATMKAMGPAALRAMNPQMARMTDEQINMAIAQMESVANDPNQLKMAAEQMKNMSEDDLRRAMNLAGGAGGGAAAPSSNASSSTRTSSASSSAIHNNNNITNNISKTQFEQAAQQMSSLSPTQLRQQAAMLRSMPYDTLRKTNPPMAHMTDAQIEMSIKQLEQMAENPELMKLAADQMKSMTEEQYESVKQMLGGGGGGGGGSGGATNNTEPTATTSMPMLDPSNIMEGLLSNPEQLNTIVRTMKKNPELLKQVLGGAGGPNAMVPEKQKEQLNRAIDSFVQMDDAKMEKYLSLANGVQRMVKPVVSTMEKVKKHSGLSMRTLLLLMIVSMLITFGMVAMKLWMWWNHPSRDGTTTMTTMMMMMVDEVERESGMLPEMSASYDDADNEF